MNPFCRALLQICREEGNTASVEAIRNAAFAKLSTGEVKSLVSTSVNSKSFSSNISMSADKLFESASWAIDTFNNGIVTGTTFDFSLLF